MKIAWVISQKHAAQKWQILSDFNFSYQCRETHFWQFLFYFYYFLFLFKSPQWCNEGPQ